MNDKARQTLEDTRRAAEKNAAGTRRVLNALKKAAKQPA